MKATARWINEDQWACTRHMRSVILPASMERCWFKGCSERPARPEGKPENDRALRWERAQSAREERIRAAEAFAERLAAEAAARPKPRAKAAPAASKAAAPSAPILKMPLEVQPAPECAWHNCSNPARPRSKYCSRNCSNKNARARHNKRQKVA